MPSGRYVSATTSTPLGDVRVVGVCISRSHANVTGGQSDRKPWDEHRQYLSTLEAQLGPELEHGLPLVLAGDFNQRLSGPSRVPRDCRELLVRALAPLDVPTGTVHGARGTLIDHIAVRGLQPVGVEALVLRYENRPVSDHDGVVARFTR
jgi:endonuclease/exonuclease/phosphatase (EEP) superfamily protein YafD